MKKNVVKINENTLRQIVSESVKRVLNEDYGEPEYASRYEYNLMNYDPYSKGQDGERNIFIDTDEQEKENEWRRKLPSGFKNLFQWIKGSLQICNDYIYRPDPDNDNWGNLYDDERISDIMFDVNNLLEKALKKLHEV